MYRFLLFLIIFSATNTFAEDGFWSRDSVNIEIPNPKLYSLDALGEEVSKTIEIVEHRKYTSAHDHIMGLFYETYPILPSNMEKMDGIMQEVAGLIFHSTPLSSPISEEPDFKELDHLDPSKLSLQTAYGFREATEDDEAFLDAIVFWAVYLGSYLADKKSEVVDSAVSLISLFKLGEFNSSVVDDEQGYIEHVAHLLRFVAKGAGRNIDFAKTKYDNQQIDDELIDYYDSVVEMALKAYRETVAEAEKEVFFEKYKKSLAKLGKIGHKHDKDAPVKSTVVDDDFVQDPRICIGMYETMHHMTELEVQLNKLESSGDFASLADQADRIDLKRAQCQEDIAALKAYSLHEQDFDKHFAAAIKKSDIKPTSRDKELKTLDKARKKLVKVEKYLHKVPAFKMANSIAKDKKVDNRITRRDVINNLRHIARVYGSIEEALNQVPDYEKQLLNFYRMITYAFNNMLDDDVSIGIEYTYEQQQKFGGGCFLWDLEGIFECRFINNNFVFILPEFLYDFNFSQVTLRGVWPPELQDKQRLSKWQELDIYRAEGGKIIEYERWYSNLKGKMWSKIELKHAPDDKKCRDIDVSILPDCWYHLSNITIINSGSSTHASYIWPILPKGMSKMQSLKRFQLSGRGFGSFPDWIGDLESLEKINFIRLISKLRKQEHYNFIKQRLPNFKKITIAYRDGKYSRHNPCF